MSDERKQDGGNVNEEQKPMPSKSGAPHRIKDLLTKNKQLRIMLDMAEQERDQLKAAEADRVRVLEEQAAIAAKAEDERRVFLWRAFIDLAMKSGVRPKYKNFDARVEAAHIFISTDLLNELLQFPLCCEMVYGLSDDHEACKRLSRLHIREAIRWLVRLSLDIEQKLLFLQSGDANQNVRLM